MTEVASNVEKASSAAEPPDEVLVARAVDDAGSERGRRAASQLFARHQRRVYLWCFRYVRDHERALELAQEVFLKAYRSLGRFRREALFSSWLFAIARYHCLSALRAPSLLVDEEAEPAAVADPSKGPEERLEEVQEEENLLRVLRTTLTPQEQEAIWLRCNERMPVDEITRALGLDTASGARGLLQTARRKLRAALHRTTEEGT